MRLPRVKRVHQPFVLPGNRIVIGLSQFGVASEIADDEDGSIAAILSLMDGTRTVDDICADFGKTHPGVDDDSVRAVIEDLVGSGFVEDAGAPVPANLSEREIARYESARHFFSWIDTTPRTSPHDVQSRIKQARVSLLGVGGTGSAVAAGLVSSGIGALRLADFDSVEESNLTRQLLYAETDVGRSKVGQAAARLRAMNGAVLVTGSETKVTGPGDVVELMTGCDLFVLCADEPHPEIVQWTNEAALRTGTPWFMSLYTGPMVVVGSFVPGETGCWACLDRQEEARKEKELGRLLPESRPNAVVAASANISGHLCALEVLYQLGGLPAQTRGRVFHWNLAVWDHQYFIDVPRDEGCPVCGPKAR
ncbi:TOMM precursor leader peptide-binding protein [Nonomuraea gerenzanensis]|uniref:Sulfur carrier protein adenylyltransferase ThiF n=1 Tax=Nonomuraea gerenzanensis TaxID=93944 RepID=A0A1M4EBP7_9ACTN|nr:TOMM precursor leader peptide-binding protein [Nonomuraea gerenzanensis]UBU18335.1 TOMM precursor leader peptide-binding protein [Nonomuraea gerenzanensis]SBO96162.1 Sulfur carrier protein adenylyltransferase ThiF [Nonomuraea gerenzanensis]